MEDKLFDRIMTVSELVLAILLFVCMGIIFINQAIIHHQDCFISTMFLLLFILCSWMLKLAVKETKQAFN